MVLGLAFLCTVQHERAAIMATKTIYLKHYYLFLEKW